ncbi:apolipoprotein N-acyltransferase [Trueperella pyogenes]
MIKILLAFLGGLSLWLANPPVGLWIFAFAAIALLWLAVRGKAMAAAFGLGWIWGVAFFFPHVAWASVATGTVLAQVALAVVQGAFYGIVGALWALLSRERDNRLSYVWLRVIGAAGIFLAVEELRSMWPYGGLPWGRLAFTFAHSHLVNLAPWGSTALVGGVAVMVGVLAATAIRMSGLGKITAVVAILAFVIVPVILPTGGRASGSLNVAIVQGNTPSRDAHNRALVVTENHVRATRELIETSDLKPDLILWPESASDRDIRTDRAAGDLVFTMVEELGIPLVMGTQEYIADGRYNDVLVIEPGAGITARYSKQHPVPFGEYIPHRDFFRQFSDAVDLVSTDMLAGTGQATVEVSSLGVTLAVPVCFEVAYTDIVAQAIPDSQLLVIPTNNASFGTTALSAQQFAMTQFRAVEHGRTAIQVSTSGISGVATAHGVVYETNLFTTDARVAKVALHNTTTFATRTAGERTVAVYVLGALGAILALYTAYRGRS